MLRNFPVKNYLYTNESNQKTKTFKTTNYLKFLFARYFCVTALEKNKKIYSIYWLILPNWRYYLRQKYSKSNKRFGRYNSEYWKPNRIQIWKINNYKIRLYGKSKKQH